MLSNPKDSLTMTLYSMLDSPKFSKNLIMTSSTNDSLRGAPPPPIIDLTMEQEFQLTKIEGLLEEASLEDIKTVFMALQEQCYVLSNNVANLVKKW